jgi:hypothetical protein
MRRLQNPNRIWFKRLACHHGVDSMVMRNWTDRNAHPPGRHIDYSTFASKFNKPTPPQLRQVPCFTTNSEWQRGQ